MQDRYGRQRQPRDFQAIVIENENLKATFLPELGGRLMSLFHKPTNRELLFSNPVFQPANLATRDAWFAGGIEWNIGQYGHAFHTCAPVFAAAIPGLNSEQGLRLYDYERCKGLFWQIDFYLPPGAQFLYAFTRVLNPRDAETSMYWWTNTAVPEAADVRVLAPTNEAVYVDLAFYLREGRLAYGQHDLPTLETFGGKDATYSVNSSSANEFYFQCQEAELPWEAALDGRGTGFVEASTHPLNVRKLFCWGQHQGGRHWQEFLSVPGQSYIEIQAGLAPTQVHGLTMPGRSQWSWTQAFGYVDADPGRVHGADWAAAWKTVDAAPEGETLVRRAQPRPRRLPPKGRRCAAGYLQLRLGLGRVGIAAPCRSRRGETADIAGLSRFHAWPRAATLAIALGHREAARTRAVAVARRMDGSAGVANAVGKEHRDRRQSPLVRAAARRCDVHGGL